MVTSSLAWAWVRALNCLQNSMMFTPCWPSAGPMGGAGLALPAGICSLMYPVTFFISSSGFLYLREVQLDRRGAAEDREVDPDLLLLRLHLHHHPGEVGEGPRDHPHAVALLVGDARLRAGGALGDGGVDALDLGLLDGLRVHAAQEAGDLRGVLDQVKGLLVEIHLHEHVARE